MENSAAQSGSKVWFITGVSRGLGKELALAALEAGHRVAGTTRTGHTDLPPNDNLKIYKLDVTNEKDVHKVVQQAHADFGRLSVVVNNAGWAQMGCVEELTLDSVRHQYETNVLGAYAVIQAALPFLRKQHGGQVVNISSIGGLSSSANVSAYNSSKFALEAIGESLSKEVAQFGIKVTNVEPGMFATDFMSDTSIKLGPKRDPAYDSMRLVTSEKLTPEKLHGKQPGDPKKGARVIVQVIDSAEPPLRLPLGEDAYQKYKQKLESELKALNEAPWLHAARNTAFTDKP